MTLISYKRPTVFIKVKIYYIYSFLLFTLLFSSCSEDWLDIKSRQSLVVPTSADDFQAILNNTSVMNVNYPIIGEISADNYYLTQAQWNNTPAPYNSAHIWENNLFKDIATSTDWNNAYKRIFYANTVLDGIEKHRTGFEPSVINKVKGQALFFRGQDFYNIASIFTTTYEVASDELGIPLRLNSDINEISVRSSLEATYRRIIADLKQAANLLQPRSEHQTQPSKASAFGLLARVFLDMQDYKAAYNYADSCLQIQNVLIDYNDLDSSANFPIPFLNEEVIFHSTRLGSVLGSNAMFVDSSLYLQYDKNDLRRSHFFRNKGLGGINFIGSYTGVSTTLGSTIFGGIATDEIYLIRAECNIRLGKARAAIDDLNRLLKKRWKAGTYTDKVEIDFLDILSVILEERRKELLFRGLRWTDLKRLNRDPRRAITIFRTLNNQFYQLRPNDLKYAIPIPPDVVYNTSMPQNKRN